MALVPQTLEVNRRTDIEALRILVCVLVMLLHALLIFAPQPYYHLKSAEASPLAGVLAEALRVMVMPLFFVIAGWSAIVSLRTRSWRSFLAERGRRILLPLLTGMALVCPFIKYIELRGGRDMRPAGFRLVAPLADSFWQFLPRFYGRLASTTWSHLWFLAYLLVLSVLLLPVLLRLGRRPPATAAVPLWAVPLPGIGLGLLVWAVGGYWPYYPNLYGDPGNLAYYGACLLLGAGLAAWPGFEAALPPSRHALAWLALLALAGVAWLDEGAGGRFCVGMAAWCGTAALLGLARRHAPAPSALLGRLGEATLPVYVLHHAPELAIGAALLSTGWAWPVQSALVWLLGLLASAALYLALVRPFRPMRTLFGMPQAGAPAEPGRPHPRARAGAARAVDTAGVAGS